MKYLSSFIILVIGASHIANAQVNDETLKQPSTTSQYTAASEPGFDAAAPYTAQHNLAAVRIGPGDSKVGYETKNYKTDSRAIEARRGETANLIRLVNQPPLGLPPIPQPKDNPITEEKIALGKKLFFDRRLSLNDTFSCAMCHIPEQGFTSHELEKAVGFEGRSNKRNSPTLYNSAYLKKLFHDNRETTLEDQIWGPLLARNEMAMPSIGEVINKIKSISDYKGLFEAAFNGQTVSIENLGKAIATYQRVLVSGNSNFDKWYFGQQEDAISAQAKRGFELFKGKAQCIVCHQMKEKTALFTDNKLHNTGIGFINSMGQPPEKERMLIAPGIYADVKLSKRKLVGHPPIPDLGFYEVTQNPADRWKYRTPGLRNVALTQPYMHDGSMQDLLTVVEFYNKGGIRKNEAGFPNQSFSPLMNPLNLSQQEMLDIVAFMETLTGDNIAEIISDAFATPVGDTQ